jgi:hypothetical protein
MAFQLIQILFWLSLSAWFGCVLFIAVAAPIVFRTVREANPVLPSVLSVNMEGQHGTLLAGTIVFNLLKQLRIIQFAAAAMMLVAIIAQVFFIDLNGTNGTAALVRGGLFFAALGVLLFDWLIVAPKIEAHRQEYLDNADEPDIANPAKEKFDQQHARSVGALQVLLFCLLGMILFSASVTPRPRDGLFNPGPATNAPTVEKSN